MEISSPPKLPREKKNDEIEALKQRILNLQIKIGMSMLQSALENKVNNNFTKEFDDLTKLKSDLEKLIKIALDGKKKPRSRKKGKSRR